MKCIIAFYTVRKRCRSPCGERGLKYLRTIIKACDSVSLPVRGAWIEIAELVVFAKIN